jgi:hypothetical protein
MKIGDNNNILIERGKYIYLAVIFSGRGTSKLRTKVRNILEDIETKFELPFRTWVGDMDKLAGVERLLQPLIPEGGRPVMVSDKQLGRVPAPRPGGVTPKPGPGYTAPAPASPAPAAVKPVTTVKPVQAATPTTTTAAKPITATPAGTGTVTPVKAVTPTQPQAKPAAAVVAKPATATTTTATPAKPATAAAAATPSEPKCPKCGATAKKFPDGSLLCPKCGYTGN